MAYVSKGTKVPLQTRIEQQANHYRLTRVRIPITLQESEIASLAQAATFTAINVPLSDDEYRTMTHLASLLCCALTADDPFRVLINRQLELAAQFHAYRQRKAWPAEGAPDVSADDRIEPID